MTRDETMALAAERLDQFFAAHLTAIEARVRADIAATGPEDEAALDRPPDPASAWHRLNVEQVIELYQEAWPFARGQALCEIGRALSAMGLR